MMFYLLIQNKSSKKSRFKSIETSYIKTFIVFIILMGCSLVINGEFFEYEFIKKSLAYYLVDIVVFFSLTFFISDKKDLSKLIFLLSAILLFNNIVTILQFQLNTIGWVIGQLFSDLTNDLAFLENHDDLHGISKAPGIFGHVVGNAFQIAIIYPLVLSNFFNRYNRFNTQIKIYLAIVCLSSVFACYATQQRTAIVLIAIASLLFSIIYFKKHTVFLFFLIIIGILFSEYIISTLDKIDWGRLNQKGDDIRENLQDQALTFLSDNLLFGGPMAFQKRAGLSTHSIFFDSFIFAGLAGGICLLYLFFKTLKTSFIVLRKSFKKYEYSFFFIALSVFFSMMYGVFHNTSYLTGDAIIFIALAMMLKMNTFTQVHKN